MHPSKYSVLILILDGCNIRIFKYAKVPNIRKLMKEGCYTFKCKSIYPTVTYSAHASIITGSYPSSHGIVGNSFFDKNLGRIIDFDHDDINLYLLTKTCFERVEGTKIAIGEPVTRGADIIISKKDIQSRRLFNQDLYALNRGIKLIKRYKPILTVINLPGIDGIGETYGPFSEQLLDHLERVDFMIGNIINIMDEIFDDYIIIILSDHGIVNVYKNISIKNILMRFNVILCISHRMAHIYGGPENIKKISRLLSGDYRFKLVMPHDELHNYHLDNYRSGDLVVFAKTGYELDGRALRGSHGGMSRGEVFIPLIINRSEYKDVLENSDITVVVKIIFRFLREQKIIGIVKDELKKTDPAHGWEHTSRVLNIATNLAIKYNANVEMVRLSCLFHDCKRGLDPINHEIKAALFAEKILTSENYSRDFIEAVKHMILRHHEDPNRLMSTEEKILWDADKLDALGLAGLARCLLEAGYLNMDIENAINHLLTDIREFGQYMHFKETQRAAKIKISRALKFLNLLRRELG